MPAIPPERHDAAHHAARAGARQLARATGARLITRPPYAGADTTILDVEPFPGIQAARDLEIAARHVTCAYIQRAREAGHSWYDIGLALNFTPDPAQPGRTIAEAAYTYAASDRDTYFARTHGRSFSWICPKCEKCVIDRGLDNHPADNERGHHPECPRLQATITAWETEWEAGQ